MIKGKFELNINDVIGSSPLRGIIGHVSIDH